MAKQTSNTIGWRTRLQAELRRDKKKTTTLILLVVVAGAVGGKFIVGQLIPAKASGGVQASAEIVESDNSSTDNNSLIPVNFEIDSKIPQGHQAKVTRDIFYFDKQLFPLTKGKGLEGDWGDAASGGIAALARKELHLQSTIVGPSPVAIINGQVIRVGQKIRVGQSPESYEYFEVVEVTRNSCVVKKDGVLVKLQMNSSGLIGPKGSSSSNSDFGNTITSGGYGEED